MLKIDKASMLCLDKRLAERKSDIEDIKDRLLKMGAEFELFLAGDGKTAGLGEIYDYEDSPSPDVSKWGYGLPGHKQNHWNAFQCHQIMIRRAKDEGCQNLLVLEDDAYLTSRFENVWKEVAQTPYLDTNYHLLYLGWWIGDENDEWNKKVEKNWLDSGTIEIARARQVGGLHGCLVDASMFDALLSLKPNNPIDYQLNIMGAHERLNSYIILPKIVHTRTTFSYCEGSVITRNEL